jgi:predicted CXXCH cytochrome family protein
VTTRLLTIGALGFVLLNGACTGGTQDHARIEVRSADCIVCHASDVQQALNPPHEGFPDTCGTCHSNDAWMPAAFDHRTPTLCVGCHQSDYDNSPFPEHDTFPTTCQDCHTTNAWTPAVGGTHPENAFPIQDGPHSKYRTDCVSCHDPELGSSIGGENADCVGCHDDKHTREKMDPKHDEEPDYPQGAAPPNFCLDCHPDGRN